MHYRLPWLPMRLRELEDYTWFPHRLRMWQMDYIGWIVEIFQLYRPLVSTLHNLCQVSGSTQLYDLCSGSGRPARYLARHLAMISTVIATDLHPYEADSDDEVTYASQPVDALEAGIPEGSLVTMFNAFHHFDREAQARLLTNIMHQRRSYLIAEILEPTGLCSLQILLTTTVGQWLTAPLVRPWSIARVLLTYLPPINIITVCYDGLLSVLRSRSTAYYRDLIGDVDTSLYEVEVGRLPSSWGSRVIYIKGRYAGYDG